ncbi:MAG: hypothetical protein SGI74_13885 [Oligoflexia bacterium]|nr:hypothetical protein [Oligoflexia bacterium]
MQVGSDSPGAASSAPRSSPGVTPTASNGATPGASPTIKCEADVELFNRSNSRIRFGYYHFTLLTNTLQDCVTALRNTYTPCLGKTTCGTYTMTGTPDMWRTCNSDTTFDTKFTETVIATGVVTEYKRTSGTAAPCDQLRVSQ